MPKKVVKKVKETMEKEEKEEVSKIKKSVENEIRPKDQEIEKSKKGARKVEKVVSSKSKKTKTKSIAKSKKEAIENKKITKKVDIQQDISEYYDLPYRYNETAVKILAQTPKRLFVYWEVSEKDKEAYMNAFGEDFFEKTYPVLLVHNEELNYTVEVPINDFANSWYLDIKDPKTKYVVKLGRKFRNMTDVKVKNEILKEENINLQNDFIYITDSNKLETPNDHILFEKMPNQIIYRNIKTGSETNKNSVDILDKFEQNYEDVNMEIKEAYYKLYGDEISEEILLNPSSGSVSTIGKSSSFK